MPNTRKREQLKLFHCLSLDSVSYGVLQPDPSYSDVDFLPAYRWAEAHIGFYPLFMGIGKGADVDVSQAGAPQPVMDVSITGYSNQWRRIISSRNEPGKGLVNVLRKKGESPNFVLLIFDEQDIEGGVCTDYMSWHIILNDCMGNRVPDKRATSSTLKRSWSKARWYCLARKDSHAVQVMVPQLDMRKAREIWVRNKSTQRKLESMGFSNVKVKRLAVRD